MKVVRLWARNEVEHSGEGIGECIDWLLQMAGGDASSIAIAIEVPHGAMVESLIENNLAVFAINPKQMDRFRDRHTVAGAKDDDSGRICDGRLVANRPAVFSSGGIG